MLIKRNVICIFFLTIMLTGCEWYRPPNEPLDADAVLRNNIVGKWCDGEYYKITYYANDTFVESSLTRNRTDTNQLSLDKVLQGKYSITNSLLKWTNIHCAFLDTTRHNGLSILFRDSEIQIVGNRLIYIPLDILISSEQNDSDICGTWTNIMWVYHQIMGTPPSVYEGRERYTYTFYQDSAYCRYGAEYLDGNPLPNPSWKFEFSYNPPILCFDGDSIRVEFKYGNKMYWYYNEYIGEIYRE